MGSRRLVPPYVSAFLKNLSTHVACMRHHSCAQDARYDAAPRVDAQAGEYRPRSATREANMLANEDSTRFNPDAQRVVGSEVFQWEVLDEVLVVCQ